MVIGQKIATEDTAMMNRTMVLDKITDTAPVKKCDDGESVWYEVCEASQTNLVAVIGISDGMDSVVIINRDNGIDLLLDIL